jgi:hypothetical protein
VSLSIALHAGVFYAIGRVPWAASEIPQPIASPPHQIVWLEDWRRPNPDQRALDAVEESARAADNQPSEVPPPERTANVTPPARLPAAPKPVTVPSEPATAPVRERVEPSVESNASSEETSPPASTLPEVDWEKERHDAVRDVLEQRSRQREYLTFSLDDVIEEPEPVEPVLPPLMVDNCVIVKGKLQRFAALMMGRCVREARSDLFASIKPAYLRAHPVCVETRPDNPGSFLSDGTQISTVKCELVVDDEQ